MGNLIKINMYVENKQKKHNRIEIKNLEQDILKYNEWLRRTNREDKIETYEMFLQAK